MSGVPLNYFGAILGIGVALTVLFFPWKPQAPERREYELFVFSSLRCS